MPTHTGKDPSRQRRHRPPITMRFTEAGTTMLQNNTAILARVGLYGRSAGEETTRIIGQITAKVTDVDALSITISDPAPIEMGIRKISLLDENNTELASYGRRRPFLELDPATPLLWTLNVHFNGQDIRHIQVIESLQDITGARVLKHRDLNLIPFHPRHPKMSRHHQQRRAPFSRGYLTEKRGRHTAAWAIGDIRWSVGGLGRDWLLADGSTHACADFPDLAALSSTWLVPGTHAPLTRRWIRNTGATSLFQGGNITSIAANDHIYVAVGSRQVDGNTGPVIAHSFDGTSWSDSASQGQSGFFYPVNVLWVPELGDTGLFVVGGIASHITGIKTSPDGMTWTRTPLTVPADLHSEATGAIPTGERYPFGHLKGLAAGSIFSENGMAQIRVVILDHNGYTLVSDDGYTWKYPSTSGAEGFNNYGNTLVWGQTGRNKGLFVAGGDNSMVSTSPDGIQWTPCPSATEALGPSKKISTMAWGPCDETMGAFIITSEDGIIITSHDAENWEYADHAPHNIMAAAQVSLHHNHKIFIIGGYGAEAHDLMTSPDGRTWSKITDPSETLRGKTVYSISHGKGQLLIGGESGFLASHTTQDEGRFTLPDVNHITGVSAYIKAR